VKEIVFYRTARGSSPVTDFLDSLSGREAQKVAWVLRLIEEIEVVPAHYFKKLSGYSDLWEVRVEFSGNALRLLGFLHGTKLIVLVHGFKKKSQKTPPGDIRLAEARKADYLRRFKNK